VTDHDERRRIQNRQAQRRFSKCKSLPILQTYYTLSYIDNLFLAVLPVLSTQLRARLLIVPTLAKDHAVYYYVVRSTPKVLSAVA
jgi:hypothetical protein